MRRRRIGSEKLRCSRCIWWRFRHCHCTRDRCRGAPGARCGPRRLHPPPRGSPPNPGAAGPAPPATAEPNPGSAPDLGRRRRAGGCSRRAGGTAPRSPTVSEAEPRRPGAEGGGTIAARPERGAAERQRISRAGVRSLHPPARLIPGARPSAPSPSAAPGRPGGGLAPCPPGWRREPGQSRPRNAVGARSRPAQLGRRQVPPGNAPPLAPRPRDGGGCGAASPRPPTARRSQARSPSRPCPAALRPHPCRAIFPPNANPSQTSPCLPPPPLPFPSRIASCKWGDKSRKCHAPWRRETGGGGGHTTH